MPAALETSEATTPNANTPSTPGEVHGGGFDVAVSDAESTTVASASAPSPAPGSAPGSHLAKRLRILLVDDEPGLAKTLKFLLDDVYDTEAFTSGSAALERILEGDPFDIVLCDLMMPNVSGIDLYHRVAETRPGQEARIFFMTGGAFTPRGLAFLEQVPNPRLEKPFSPEDFDRAIEHWRLTMGTHL